mmetsp:Transcript_133362/g.230731  ORF Transcript_133362/g.230731 Transcript_133362/m.230731 type:complete len:166 (-) Transcript_133362:109-606(-)
MSRYYLAQKIDEQIELELPKEKDWEEGCLKGIPVREGTWVSEACLWQRCRHAGRMIAVTTVANMCILVDKFCLVIESAQHQNIDCSFLRSYANEVVRTFSVRKGVIIDLWDMETVEAVVSNVQRASGSQTRGSVINLWQSLGLGQTSTWQNQQLSDAREEHYSDD